MKKKLLLFVLFSSSILIAQNSWDRDQRKGNLFFSVGTEYRITPIYSGFDDGSLPVNVDYQNSGIGFNFNFDFFITKNLSVGLGNTLRYDMVSLNYDEITDIFGSTSVKNDFIYDVHIYLDYHFKIFKKGELFLRLGRSLRNNGAQFVFREPLFDQNGNFVTSVQGISQIALYEPWNFAIGYKNKRVSIMLGIYTTGIPEYFSSERSFIVPYFSITYNLGKL